MRSIAANALFLMIVLGVALAGALSYAIRMVDAPGPLAEMRQFVIPRGASVATVSEVLEREGVIDSATLFRLAARYRGQDGDLRFGEYEVGPGASLAEVIDLLTRGSNVQYAVTAPEGLTSAEIVAILNAEPLLTGQIDATPPEGALAPDTYAIQRGDDRAAVIARMTALQARRIQDAWEGRADGLLLESPLELLILASIIEKETALVDEMQRVSAVFHNRLRRGMRLQSDPTIIYGITEGAGPLGRALTRSDIDTPTPWNTYAIPALPPTPIANPGAAALQAAANPADDDAIFFVADGTGGHAFARTLQEHNRNVRRWRAIERERRNSN